MTDKTSAFRDLHQHALADQARAAFRFVRAAERAQRESEAARDLAALNKHLQNLAIQPVMHPVIDADGVVTVLIYRLRQPSRPGDRKDTRIWACARLGRIWLRRADDGRHAIDDEQPFADLADLGRVLLEGPAQPQQNDALARAAEILNQATGLHGKRCLGQAVIGLGWAILACAAQHR
ncbi:hypothetical protein [Actinomadura sp. NPDC048394]|uniref:hypothetical protein n=1 Tax=Actinomadura sp. NPDC048394 TaxID=3158223 RepID=UPI0033F3C4DF